MKHGTGKKRTTKTRLIKPVNETEWKLTEPEWHGNNHVSFLIPTWFDPAEYIGGLEKRDPNEYVNLYLHLCTVTGCIELNMVVCGGTAERDVVVEMDGKSRKVFGRMLARDFSQQVQEHGGARHGDGKGGHGDEVRYRRAC